jgi:FixJ family two-component response regulator/anti-sigma regulatory factor (Ser/Thr protein kinase)
MDELGTRLHQVLVVEDDPHVLSFMESSLRHSGIKVISATSLQGGRSRAEQTGLDKLEAVLLDYWLPDGDGIELLKWLHEQDPTLATTIITGQGEKTVVQKAMTHGAYHYLEKPVTHQQLRQLMQEAMAHTRSRRQSVRDRRGLQELEQLDQRMSSIVPEALRDRVRVFYQPLHEVGGDFFISHMRAADEWLLLLGDVSGHDIKSGFVSTYFQGMFRGCVANGSRVRDFIDLFNRTLYRQRFAHNEEGELISLSLSAFHLDFHSPRISHWNYGLTPCHVVSRVGRITQCPVGNFPLGWMDSIDLEPHRITTEPAFCLYAFTDGLLEYANDLRIHPFSLLYRLMHQENIINNLPIDPNDDILAFEYIINPTMTLKTQYTPIISEHYAGTEVEHIDHLQSNWRRSLNFALDDRLGDRLYDLLICIREGMLNALIHGCEKAPDKFAHLQISLSGDKESLRVVIDDPGHGHSFDLKQRLEEIGGQAGKHLGLGIIQHLSDDFHIENKGTSLVFDFEINPVDA